MRQKCSHAPSFAPSKILRGGGKALTALLLTLLVAACGGDDDPIDPQYPQVAGTYTGQITFTWDLLEDPLTGSMRIEVAQSESQLTITGSITLLEESKLPAVTGTINETGFFTAKEGGYSDIDFDRDCGVILTTSSTLTFSGSTAKVFESATTERCGDLEMSGTLNKLADN